MVCFFKWRGEGLRSGWFIVLCFWQGISPSYCLSPTKGMNDYQSGKLYKNFFFFLEGGGRDLHWTGITSVTDFMSLQIRRSLFKPWGYFVVSSCKTSHS